MFSIIPKNEQNKNKVALSGLINRKQFKTSISIITQRCIWIKNRAYCCS